MSKSKQDTSNEIHDLLDSLSEAEWLPIAKKLSHADLILLHKAIRMLLDPNPIENANILTEPDNEFAPLERCCFCRAPATRWTLLPDRSPGEQVGICRPCALTRNPSDVPSKVEWCEKERNFFEGGRGSLL